MIIDLREEVRESRDSKFLAGFLRTLIGLPCLKVELTYGDELTIHLGAPAPYRHPKLADEFKGAWIIGSRGSNWTVAVVDPPYSISSDELSADRIQEVEAKTKQLAGTTVLDVFAGTSLVPGQIGFGELLSVRLSNTAHISIVPSSDPDETGLPDWEIFTPFGMYLSCGPGAVWSYLPSENDGGDFAQPKSEAVT